MKAQVFLVQTEGEWFYMWDKTVSGLVPMLWNININTEYDVPTDIKKLGEIDVLEFTETVRDKIGEFLRHYETQLSSYFNTRQKTRIIFGRDGRIYTFRKPEDILKFKVTPVRLGYFFNEVPPNVLIAWERHLAYCRSRAIITTDAKVWRSAYRDISSCMQNREEIEFYIENPHAFEIAALYDEQEDKVYARAVIYKTVAGNKYYYRIYSNTSGEMLEKYLENQGIKYIPSSGNLSLPICIARSNIGIPYLDAFFYGTLFEERYENREYKYKLLLQKERTENTNVILQFVHDTKSLLDNPCVCESCGLLFPEEAMQGEFCNDCAERYSPEDDYCDNCGCYVDPEDLIFREGVGYCRDCFLDLFTIYCDFCEENIEFESTPIRTYNSIWIDLYKNVDWEFSLDQRNFNRETICLNCFREHFFEDESRINYTFGNFGEGSEKEVVEEYWLSEKLITFEIRRPERKTILIPVHPSLVDEVLRSQSFMDFLREVHAEIQ